MAEKPLILVVDDDSNIRDVLTLALTQENYTVISAENGEEGLKLCSAKKPALIVLDLQMPRMDGWQVLESLHNSKTGGTEIPVIMLTASSSIGNADKAFKYGAVSFLPKPIDLDRLFKKIQTVLAIKKPA